jgi:hypothetical protein
MVTGWVALHYMKVSFSRKLKQELVEMGYLYVAYFDAVDRTIIYPFKFPIREERLVRLNFHQLPIDDLVVDYMAEEASTKNIFISNKYFASLTEQSVAV